MDMSKLIVNVGARFRPDPTIEKAAHILNLLEEARAEVESLGDDVEITWGPTEKQKLEDAIAERDRYKSDFESQEKLLNMYRQEKTDKKVYIILGWVAVAAVEFVLLMTR